MTMKKKPKKYADGGLAGIAKNAQSLMGDVDSMANTINYGSSTPSGNNQPLGMLGIAGGGNPLGQRPPGSGLQATPPTGLGMQRAGNPLDDLRHAGNIVNTGGPSANPARSMMKKGGEVKASKAPKASSASKRGDGIAMKGKTKGRIV